MKSVAIGAWIAVGLPGAIKPRGIGRCVPSFASWLAIEEDRKKIAAEIQTVMYDQAPGIPWGQFAQPAAIAPICAG